MAYWESTGRPARKIIIGGVYDTVIAEGPVRARVTARLPATPTSRNVMFHLVDYFTGECLPKLKRASELAAVAVPAATCL